MSGDAFNRFKSFFEDIFKDRVRLIRILLIILILLLAFVMRMHENAKSDITVEQSETAGASAEQIVVDIGGAVASPGVYTVGSETRLYEVIELAGGLLSSADTDSINRAEYVEDGQKITIPVRPSNQSSVQDENAAASEDPEEEITQPDQDSVSTGQVQSGLVNINYASREELMTLSGIGEAKADKIIEYRSNKRFKSKEDIKSVNGIGDAIYSKIKDSITV